MKRSTNPKQSHARATSAKKQKSILSFFQTRAAPITPSSFSKSPSTVGSLGNASSPAASSVPSVKTRSVRGDAPSSLRRELFTETEAPRPVKRRRVVRLEDISDDEEEAVASPVPTTPEQPLERQAQNAVDDDKDDDLPVVQAFKREDRKERTTVSMHQKLAEGQGELSLNPISEHDKDGASIFKVLQYPAGRNRDASDKAPAPALPDTSERRKAREKLAELANARAVGDEEGGWCERHPWSVDIRDSKKRRPGDPNYDKTTLYVPPHLLSESRGGAKGGGLSPFQRQFWNIKSANYDVIIFFKKGKFYELYDVDADVGHEQLGLNFTKGGRVDMRCCGVPEQALDKHCGRLVDLGYKVGRVEQTETANAAEKRKNGGGSNKSAVCERSLVRILTKATVTDDAMLRDHRARYVIALAEKRIDSHRSDSDQSTSVEDEEVGRETSETRIIGVCYVDVAGGSISIQEYEDNFRLSKTERLMTYLRPQEIVANLPESSQELTEIIKWASRRSDAEIIDVGLKRGFSQMTEAWLAMYLQPESSYKRKEEFDRVVRHLNKHELCRVAFGAMASHLKSLIIDKETLSIGNFNLSPASSQEYDHFGSEINEFETAPTCGKHVRMDAPTLQNLEILSSSIDDSERGSLLSFVDQAQTPAGRRLIRKWIAEPLVTTAEIEDRLQAIEGIHRLEDEDGGKVLREVVTQMKTKKDLERALPKLHQQATVNHSAVMFDDTNKRRVREFLVILYGLQRCLTALDTLREAMESCPPTSKRLKWLYTLGCGVPEDASRKLKYFLGSAFDIDHAERSGEILPKPGAVPLYDDARAALDNVESCLNAELEKWQSRLGDSTVKFYHRGKEPYQIEVKTSTLHGRIPHEFQVVSESKSVKRFYTQRVKALVREQVEASEAYEDASSQVARDMMLQFDKEYGTWSTLSATCAELDALIGLAFASRDTGSGPMCRPNILPNDHPEAVFKAEGLRHPILAANSQSFVSNNVMLGGSENPEIMILTGPNAGGKSTLARQVALAVILAQMGCFVPAKSFSIRPFEDIFVRMGASDDLARGRSTFMVEMEEVGNILNNANTRSLIIADEVGRGTSTHDGYAVAYASLDHIAKVNKSLTVFSTHYSHLGEDIVSLAGKDGRVEAAMFEMAAVVNKVSKEITFLYKLQRGASGDSRGIYCARVAGISADVANNAEQASTDFDETLARRLEGTKFCSILKGLEHGGEQALMVLKQQ